MDDAWAGFAFAHHRSRIDDDAATCENVAAIAFWRKIIGAYTHGRFSESVHDGSRWRGPVQTFVN